MPMILIVDDRRDAIEVLQAKLQKRGFVTECTADAREIQKICAGQAIDAIVMDMNMPELDGCEATEIAKADQATAHIPIVIYTAHPLPGDQERAEHAGCDGFLEKPIHLGPLMRIFGKFFEVGDDEVEEISLRKVDDETVPPATGNIGREALRGNGAIVKVDSDTPARATLSHLTPRPSVNLTSLVSGEQSAELQNFTDMPPQSRGEH